MAPSKTAPSSSRRQLLACAATSLLSACDSPARPEPSALPGAARSPSPSLVAPQLHVVQAGDMPETDRGGVAIVLLHGWGAPGDDLVPLARQLQRARTRFFFPAAPLVRPTGGRAWWHIDGPEHPEYAYEARVPAGHRAARPLLEARGGVQRVLDDVRRRYQPERLVLGGFSQGAMLALDVALAARPRVDRVAALSGAMIVDSVPSLLALRAPFPSVLVAHGKADAVLPFAAAEAAAKLLSDRGLSVTFHPFEGGHQIPSGVLQALSRLIYD